MAQHDIDAPALGSAVARSLDRGSHEQLYYQLYNILFQDIVGNVYEIGDRLPSEPTLMDAYGVSRETVRKAMEMLVGNGLIRRERGRGSTVIANRSSSSPQRVVSYLRRTSQDRVRPVKEVISSSFGPAEERVATALALTPGEDVFSLERLRTSDGEPCYLEHLFMQRSFIPEASAHDFSKESLRAYVGEILKTTWSSVNQRISSIPADEHAATLLDIAPGTPLLRIEKVSFDVRNVPREYVVTDYRSDMYFLEIGLRS